MVLLRPEPTPEELNTSSVMDEDVLEEFWKQRASRSGSEILKNPKDPAYPLMKEFEDVVSKEPPSQLPPDRGIRHEIDLVPGTKESKSPHTFCVRKPNGKWRLVHAYNKLNSATVPAQTPIPRKDVLLNNMAGCTFYSAMHLVDGYYQILMRESDIPLTAADGLLHYRVEPGDPPRVVVPNDEDLKFDILQEAHDAPSSGHLGREKTFLSVSLTFWWPHQYKCVARYVKKCETCQRVKPFGHASALLQSLTVLLDCWKSMSLDFVIGLPADDHGNTGILVFVCRLSKMVHLAPALDTVTGEQAARLFLDCVFRHHGLSETIVSDRDPRFTGTFLENAVPSFRNEVEHVNCGPSPNGWSDGAR
ncbi:unnamed protein product [Phytophthora fragariaefolia]|uniref:Unnamed protein product n=1 Tax=Phytophthora fragariaefolia TaxID=1490495 RepID=A0A9W6XGD1_9STRA|nr:unnamed protein product [Phytophthora fragariaefolia]